MKSIPSIMLMQYIGLYVSSWPILFWKLLVFPLGYCKKEVAPVCLQWSYVFLALSIDLYFILTNDKNESLVIDSGLVIKHL